MSLFSHFDVAPQHHQHFEELANRSQENHTECLFFQAITSVKINKPFLSPGRPVDTPSRVIFNVQTSTSDQPVSLNNSIHLTSGS